MSSQLRIKLPDEEKRFGVDWSYHLEGGVDIVSAAYSVQSPLTTSSPVQDGYTTSCIIAGGEDGNRYFAKFSIDTTDGQTLETEFEIHVQIERVS